MSPLPEPMYCSQQIKVPPAFPDILKQYTKAAIRTQPRDLVRWSAAYFLALANGERPPMKQRLEFPPPPATMNGLTQGYLRALHSQSLCLLRQALDDLLLAGGFDEEQIDWLQFLALAAGTLEKDLTGTMRMVCEIITAEPAGGSAAIPYNTFERIYKYLATADGSVPDSRVNNVLEYLRTESDKTSRMVMPRQFEHQDCPPLH
ncbi:Ropporin-1-like protein [Amphibalanus amphitrite]|uniref:Ropporin-1-like protein n=1 Tax=Amphibalanus amphitrite TaxID=1232801 RepID=A0A6A4VIN3_AMPAM|nr:Ropporin-1-like protein [Amphibalanus amphitrite]